MAQFEVELGGITYDVEAENERQAVQAAKQYHLTEGALNRASDRLSFGEGAMDRFDNTGRSFARGAPVIGAFADEIAAGGDAALSYPFGALNDLLGREFKDEDWRNAQSTNMSLRDRYAMGLKKQRSKDEEFDREHPYVSTATKLGGAAAGGGALVRLFPWLFSGGSLPAKAAMGGGSGALIAGAHGFGEGEGAEDRLDRAGDSAIKGAAIGAALPVAFRGAEWLYGKGKDMLGEMTGMFGVPSRAEKTVADLLKNDDVTEQMLRDLPDGTVAMNTSPTAVELGKRIASTPGDASKRMVQAATAQKGYIGPVEEGSDQLLHRAVDNADQIINAGHAASQQIAADAAARLGGPAARGASPGVIRSVLNLTGILGKGAGDSLNDVMVAIGDRLRSGSMNEDFLEAARLLMSQGDDAANMLVRVATSQASTEAQKRAIEQVLRGLAPGAVTTGTGMVTGGRF